MKVTKPIHVVFVCSIIITSGLLILAILINLKPPPEIIHEKQPPLQVDVLKVKKRNYPVFLSASGEAFSTKVVHISPEVSGRVTTIHPHLETGKRVNKGDLLFSLDATSHNALIESGKKRLTILKRQKAIAYKEYNRVKRLLEKNKVGSVSAVDAAEKAWLSSADMVERIAHTVEKAEIKADRCKVYAEFDGRLKNVKVEKGQYVATGKSILTMVDDSLLEIHAQLYSADAGKWLVFDAAEKHKWFNGLKQMDCEISWSENPNYKWKGQLHRIVEYDRLTRSMIIAVRTDSKPLKHLPETPMPLVDGMYCSIAIPGKVLSNVVKLPASSVSIDNTVFTMVDNRLKTIAISVVRSEGDFVYINSGVSNDDLVITTRLINPLENTLISILKSFEG